MNLTYEQKLIDYMAKKNYHCIAIETIDPKGCCADMVELHTRFVRDKDVPKLKEKAIQVIEAPVGEILILTRGLEIDEEVTLGLRSFLGAKDITASGIAPWKF